MSRKELLQRLHKKGARPAYEAVGCLAVFFGLLGVAVAAWDAGYWPVAVACWLVQAHFGHSVLLAFHEGSHYTLHPRRVVNEALGVGIGSLILTPLSAFRWVHNQHHLHLGSPRDTELWPYVRRDVPRWARVLAAGAALGAGFFYSPVVFLRGVLVAERMPRGVKRRLVAEYALSGGTWAAILGAVSAYGLWTEFLVGYMVPSLLGGSLQVVRQFTEHLGLLGADTASTTRTVIDETLPGRLLSATMLHIDYHGPHHLYAKIPHFHLPEATPVVYEREMREPEASNVYRSYTAAVWAMAKTLGNPRVGAQWVGNESAARG